MKTFSAIFSTIVIVAVVQAVIVPLNARPDVIPALVDKSDAYLGYKRAEANAVDKSDAYLSYRSPGQASPDVNGTDIYLSYRDVNPALVDATDVYLSYRAEQVARQNNHGF